MNSAHCHYLLTAVTIWFYGRSINYPLLTTLWASFAALASVLARAIGEVLGSSAGPPGTSGVEPLRGDPLGLRDGVTRALASSDSNTVCGALMWLADHMPRTLEGLLLFGLSPAGAEVC